MGNPSEREATTNYAKEKINSFIENNEYHLALLIAYIYANMRLKSLITDWINPQKDKWKKTSEIFGGFNFFRLLNKCKELELLVNNEYKTLDDLRKKRNNVAHESRIWKGKLPLREENKIKSICESVINFLERTN